ncbi:MAG: hypothetical protein JRL30_10575 [Deltaproteobacteria bacterium]|nr:hypothetical protein [Deltaproteobacteria bacterium]
MKEPIVHTPPISIIDLVLLKEKGSTVTIDNTFEINEVELVHAEHPFQAFLFFSRFSGTVDGEGYSFRKCYSRGCTHNLCPHVSQAVITANRYLNRDYQSLRKAGIDVTGNLFTLETMLAKFEEKRDEFVSTLILEDYINIAKEGNAVSVDVSLEYLPAVENFANNKEKRMFFTGNFDVTHLGETHVCQRCLACYAIQNEREERETVRDLANRRLTAIYTDFDGANIRYNKVFFE